MSSAPRSGTLQRHGWDIGAAILLLVAAYFLAGAGSYHAYGRFAYRLYEEGAFFERLRMVVCVSWIFAAIRFYVFRWFPLVILGLIIAWLYNPIAPVTMRRFQWQPYDHWTMILSIADAVVLLALSYRNRQTRTT